MAAKLIIYTLCILASCLGAGAFGQEEKYVIEANIPYYNESVAETDPYIKERCKLDLYYPGNTNDFATLVWFHGGGLTGGNNGNEEKPMSCGRFWLHGK